MTNIEIYLKRITAFKMVSLAPILAIAPFLVYLIGFPLTHYCNDEGTCGWIDRSMIYGTVPLGFILMIYGIVRFFLSLRFKLTKTNEKTLRERKLKLYLFAWMATAAAPIIIVLVLGSIFTFIGSVSYDVAGTLLITIAAVFGLTWAYLLVVVVWNKLTR